MSYEMQPLDLRGRWINGGNNYANADTIEGARAYADRVIGRSPHWAGTFIAGVSIVGQMMEFHGATWRPALGDGARHESEIVRWDGPVPLTPADERKSCYSTTVLDYYEIVHEPRSDGSCKCGKYPPSLPF